MRSAETRGRFARANERVARTRCFYRASSLAIEDLIAYPVEELVPRKEGLGRLLGWPDAEDKASRNSVRLVTLGEIRASKGSSARERRGAWISRGKNRRISIEEMVFQ